jgi:hypothetical protein
MAIEKPTRDEREPGVLIILQDKTYFIPGNDKEILERLQKALEKESLIGDQHLVKPEDMFRFGDEEIRDLLNSGVTIVRGRK